MRGVLRRGDVAVDVGAYKGGYTYWMREAVGDAGTVFAFEPQPELASYLRQCVRDFNWRNVRIEEIGLSSESGERMLHAPGVEPSPAASLVGASLREGSRSYEVRVDTLDRSLAQMEHCLMSRSLTCCAVLWTTILLLVGLPARAENVWL